MSYFLREHGREHAIVGRRRLAECWRSERWNSLCFQFPNWSFQLPGHHQVGHPIEVSKWAPGKAVVAGAGRHVQEA